MHGTWRAGCAARQRIEPGSWLEHKDQPTSQMGKPLALRNLVHAVSMAFSNRFLLSVLVALLRSLLRFTTLRRLRLL